jgi:hypothetical protein
MFYMAWLLIEVSEYPQKYPQNHALHPKTMMET